MPNQPILLRMRKTWWAGRHYDLSLKTSAGTIELDRNNEVMAITPADFDVNFDNDAIEVVEASDGKPVFQLFQDGDYNVHVNAIIGSGNGRAMVIKEKLLSLNKQVTPSDFPAPLFRYPSYANRGRRL